MQRRQHRGRGFQCGFQGRVNLTKDSGLLGIRGACIGAIGALLNIVLQPRPLVVLGLNVWMGTDARADELVEIPTGAERPHRIKAHPLLLFDES